MVVFDVVYQLLENQRKEDLRPGLEQLHAEADDDINYRNARKL